MTFTSIGFLFFLPAVFGVTFSLSPRFRPSFLLLASYGFYAAWKPKYLLVIIGLTLFDYLAALMIERESREWRRKAVWIASVCANLGVLFVFKYLGIFAQEWNRISSWLSLGGELPTLDLLLPIGISFHTFQAISYTTDVYLRCQKAERSLLSFALFISWFPQMVAGPIERAHRLLPQLKSFALPAPAELRLGLAWILRGAFKKLVIAANLSGIVASGFDQGEPRAPWVAVLAVYSFAIQIYCDFSGYTDIARGSSLLFGVRLTENFEHPYLSRSFPEFWRRWHISLSTWFFEYVYQPLVRRNPNAAGPWIALFVTFALSGIWHGANPTFLAWGILNGGICALYMLFHRRVIPPSTTAARTAMLLVNFHLVCFCWIFFRAESLGAAWGMLGDIGTFLRHPTLEGELPRFGSGDRLFHATLGLVILGCAFRFRGHLLSSVSASWGKFALLLFFPAGFLILALGAFNSEAFIYFNF